VARTLQAAAAPRSLVVEAFAEALQRGEACRRPDLVRAAEAELKAADEETYWRHVVGRLRGRGHPEDTAALGEGHSETATVLFLNLQQFAPFCQGLDPEAVLQTLNQILADLTVVLDRYQVRITAHLGGGFMALARDADHAGRAIEAALDMLQVAAEFNKPREVLGLRLLPVSIGIASGAVCLGDIGTYQKMDFTAVGMPVNLAARLMRQADPTALCVSQETYHLVQGRFLFRPDNPRRVELGGIGIREVYDVVGRKEGPSGFSRR
jgi:adenylate cyclase